MWTEERSELLKRLWADGLSASQIATRLGGITRNAVIGKVHRLGLPGRATTSRVRGQHLRRDACLIAANKHLRHRSTPLLAVGMAAMRKSRPLPQPGEQLVLALVPSPVVELTIPPVLRVDLLDLKESMCRWPIGDPRHEHFHFCGCQKAPGSSYCRHHARIAFRLAERRVR